VDKIRVVFANYPVMVPDEIRRLVDEQEDMEVVGDCRGPMKILQETGKVNADIVVLAQEGSEEIGLCSQLLAVYPDLTIVIVHPTLDIAFIQQLCSYRKKVVTSNQLDIVRTMRIAAKQPCNRT